MYSTQSLFNLKPIPFILSDYSRAHIICDTDNR